MATLSASSKLPPHVQHLVDEIEREIGEGRITAAEIEGSAAARILGGAADDEHRHNGAVESA